MRNPHQPMIMGIFNPHRADRESPSADGDSKRYLVCDIMPPMVGVLCEVAVLGIWHYFPKATCRPICYNCDTCENLIYSVCHGYTPESSREFYEAGGTTIHRYTAVTRSWHNVNVTTTPSAQTNGAP